LLLWNNCKPPNNKSLFFLWCNKTNVDVLHIRVFFLVNVACNGTKSMFVLLLKKYYMRRIIALAQTSLYTSLRSTIYSLSISLFTLLQDPCICLPCTKTKYLATFWHHVGIKSIWHLNATFSIPKFSNSRNLRS
jgi:hypothetical protein